MKKNRCINPNNIHIQSIAEYAGISPLIIAAKVESWQNEPGNANKIPTPSDLKLDRFYTLSENKQLYKDYNLLNDNSEIKTFDKTEAVRISEKLNESRYYKFKVRETYNSVIEKNQHKILIYKPYNTINFRSENRNEDYYMGDDMLREQEEKDLLSNVIGEKGSTFKSIFEDKVETSSKKILSEIANSNHKLNLLAKNLLRFKSDVKIEIVDSEGIELPGKTFKSSAYYSPSENKIVIARNSKTPYSAEATLIHEILHAHSYNYLRGNSKLKQEFESLFNHIKTFENEFTDKYPLYDIDEFLVAIFTNPKFINELTKFPSKGTTYNNLWEEILAFFKDLFGIFPKQYTAFDTAFTLATNILEDSNAMIEDREELDIYWKESIEKKYLSDRTVQQTIVESLLSLQGKQTAEDTTYSIEGFTTKFKRPSAIAKAEIQGQEGYKTESLEKEQDRFKALGTLSHDMMSEVIRRAFPSENTHRKIMEITPELSDLYAKMEKVMEPFIADAKSRGSVLMTEVFVANLKLERGGTIDLLEVLPDGNYITYDLKTRFKPDKSIKRRYNKIVEFSIQKGEYKNILQEGDIKLGIPKGRVVGSKIIEAPIKYNWKTFKIIDFGNVKQLAPIFLRTDDAKLNNFINRLQSQIETLVKAEPKDDAEREAWNKLLYSKINLMQELQLKQNVAEIVNHGIVEIEFLKDYIKNESELDTRKVLSELEIYSNLQDFIDLEKLNERETEALKSIEFDARTMKKKLLERSIEITKETSSQTGITEQLIKFGMDLFGPILDDSWLRKMLTGVSGTQNPIVAVAFRKVTETLGKVRNKVDVFADELTKKIEAYEKHVGSRNYDIILNDSKTALVQEFTEDFYRTKRKKLREGDMEWIKENMTFDKEKFEKRRANYLEFLDSMKQIEINKIKASLKLKGQDEDIDISSEKIYWAGRNQQYQDWENRNQGNWDIYGKPKEQWKSQKWIDIKEGKYKGTAVEEFYDFYTDTMTQADIISPDYISPSFIPNFSQDFIERAMQNGLVGAVTHQWSELLNNLDPGYDEALYGKIDPATGKPIPGLFIPGTSKYKQQKSLDLGKSLLMFMEGVYRFEEMSLIEDTIFNLKLQLEGLEVKKTDILGRPVSGATKVDTEKNPSNNTLDQFNYFIDAVVYGKSRDTEKGFKVTGNKFTESIGIAKKGEEKVVGYAKLVDLMIKYTGLRNLGLNVYAPVTNLFAGKANQFITGAGGLYYGMDDIAKATGLVSAGNLNFPNEDALKARLILDYLQIDIEKVKRNMKGAVTQNKLEAFSEKYNAMSFMRESESALVESGALAMVLSGKNDIKFEDFKVEDGKLIIPDTFNDMKKEIFRQKVYKVNSTTFGSMSETDVLMAKKWMVGRMIMQHRSWLPQMFYKRFGSKRVDFVLDKEIEGMYWASAKVLRTLIAKGVTQGWETLTPEEQAAFKQTAMEISLLISTSLILFAMGGADDDTKKEAWYRYTKKVLGRTNSELFLFLDPTLSSQWQILISPAATISTVEEGGRLIRDMWREIGADFYEDPEAVRKKAKPGRRAAKMVPGYGQVDRFIGDMFAEEPER
jgi:hypothetical protein